MCGIAGILYKDTGNGRNTSTGRALIDMLDGCQHRGPDSTGFALYGEAAENQLRMRFFVGTGEKAARRHRAHQGGAREPLGGDPRGRGDRQQLPGRSSPFPAIFASSPMTWSTRPR